MDERPWDNPLGLPWSEDQTQEELVALLEEAAASAVAAREKAKKLTEEMQPARDALARAQLEYERRISSPMQELAQLGELQIRLSKHAALARQRLYQLQSEDARLAEFAAGVTLECAWRGHRILWLGWSVVVFKKQDLVGLYDGRSWRVAVHSPRLREACEEAHRLAASARSGRIKAKTLGRLRHACEVGQEVRAVREYVRGLTPNESARFGSERRFTRTVLHAALKRQEKKIEDARLRREVFLANRDGRSTKGCLWRPKVSHYDLTELCRCGRPIFMNRTGEVFRECELCVAERVLAETQTAPT